MNHRFLIFGTLVSLVILGIVLNTTNPTSVGPLGILIVFILIYTSALGALTYILIIGSKLAANISSKIRTRVPLRPLSLLHAYYYASVLALVPPLVVGMQSVGGVGVQETILVIVFIVAACIYLKKRLS